MAPCPFVRCWYWLSVGAGVAAVGPSRAEEPDPELAKFGVIADVDTMHRVPMRDGAGHAVDAHVPKDRDGPFPLIFVKSPYHFNRVVLPVVPVHA